jgi:ribosomal protein L16 Arg81 hydroxylase
MLKELCNLYPTSSEPNASKKMKIMPQEEKTYEPLLECLARLNTKRDDRNKKSKNKTSKKVAKMINDCTPQEESKKLCFGNAPVSAVSSEEMMTKEGTPRVEFHGYSTRAAMHEELEEYRPKYLLDDDSD